VDGAEGQQLQNGAQSAVEGDVGQLINLEDDDGYRVEVRQQTEQTSHTAEHLHQQLDGTEEVRSWPSLALYCHFHHQSLHFCLTVMFLFLILALRIGSLGLNLEFKLTALPRHAERPSYVV